MRASELNSTDKKLNIRDYIAPIETTVFIYAFIYLLGAIVNWILLKRFLLTGQNPSVAFVALPSSRILTEGVFVLLVPILMAVVFISIWWFLYGRMARLDKEIENIGGQIDAAGEKHRSGALTKEELEDLRTNVQELKEKAAEEHKRFSKRTPKKLVVLTVILLFVLVGTGYLLYAGGVHLRPGFSNIDILGSMLTSIVCAAIFAGIVSRNNRTLRIYRDWWLYGSIMSVFLVQALVQSAFFTPPNFNRIQIKTTANINIEGYALGESGSQYYLINSKREIQTISISRITGIIFVKGSTSTNKTKR